MKKNVEVQTVSAITYKVNSVTEVQIEEWLAFESLAASIMNIDSDGIEDNDEWVISFERFEYGSKLYRFDLEIKIREYPH